MTPFPIMLLDFAMWELAFNWLAATTCGHFDDGQAIHAYVKRAKAVSDTDHFVQAANAVVDFLFDRGEGHLAIAWMAMTADPRRPASFERFMPQLSRIVQEHGDAEQRARIDIWWRAAAGEYVDSDIHIFAIADVLDSVSKEEDLQPLSNYVPHGFRSVLRSGIPENHVVVMPRGPVDDKLASVWKNLVGEPLPLVVAADVAEVRRRLHAEFPHATRVVDTLLRDVREGRPVRLTPTVLLGPAGSGKSRLVRRVAEELGCHVHRHDAAGSHDGMFSGSPKAWAGSQPSVPARAILTTRKANPVVLVDEIEKSGSGTYNGRLWDAMVPFLERETSARHHETSLDVEIRLDWISYVATANSLDGLPGPLLDRFRVVRVPAPTLEHLPALAAHVMADLARHDEDRMHDEPLAADELVVIGRAWRAERFSMRKLQRLVSTTLQVRDQCARRH